MESDYNPTVTHAQSNDMTMYKFRNSFNENGQFEENEQLIG